MATGASAGWRYPVPAVTTSLTACAVQNVETKTGRRSPERDGQWLADVIPGSALTIRPDASHGMTAFGYWAETFAAIRPQLTPPACKSRQTRGG